MSLARVLSVVFLGLTAFLLSADAEATQRQQAKRPVRGIITAVANKENGNATITVKVQAGKKDAATEGTEKKFTINKDTKIVKVKGKQDQGEPQTAAVSDLRKNSRILIVARGDTAQKVTIVAKGKK